MAAVLFFLPYDIAIKPTNVGAPSARLYVYVAGTTTLRSVYASDSLTTQLSNPVIADGAGRFPPIYLDNSLSYKIVIEDKNGAELYQRDPYIPGEAPDSAALQPYQDAAAASATAAADSASDAASSALASAASATAAAASATAAGASATSVTAAEEAIIAALAAGGSVSLAELEASGLPLSPMWYGAGGAGATDDYAAFVSMFASGGTHFRVSDGTYNLSAPLDPPSGVTIELSPGATLVATNPSGTEPWVFNISTGKSHITVDGGRLTPDDSGDAYRAAIQVKGGTHHVFKNIIVDDVDTATGANGIVIWDSDDCEVDNLYYDGGPTNKTGTAVYGIGLQGCKYVNSTSINCFAGLTLAGPETDPDSTRTTADSSGNIVSNCHVRYCRTQGFDIIGSVGNTFTGCTISDYAGVTTHKGFQVKDTAGDETRANVFIGCTVKNYPAGFGGQQGSHAKFIGCVGQNLTTNGIEVNSCTAFSFIGCSFYEVAQAAIWTGSGTIRCTFDGINIETSTATCVAIKLTGPGDSANNFDNIITGSTLAQFINIAAGCNDNSFGEGCRSNGQAIVDAGGTSHWPVHATSVAASVTSAPLATPLTPKRSRGMQVVKAEFVVTTTITGAPQVSVGKIGSTASVAAAQNVTGSAGAVVSLALTGTNYSPGEIPVFNVTTAGSAGAGYVQVSGLLLN